MGYGGDSQMYSGHQMPPQNQYPPQMTQPMAHSMNHQPMTNQNQAYHSEHQQQHMSQSISQPMSQPQTTQSHQQMAQMSQPQATQPQQMPPLFFLPSPSAHHRREFRERGELRTQARYFKVSEIW